MKSVQSAFVATVLYVVLALGGAVAFAQSSPQAAPTGPGRTDAAIAGPTGLRDHAGRRHAIRRQLWTGLERYFHLRAVHARGSIVQTVMAMLALASLWSWAIIFNKWSRARTAQRSADRFEKSFWSERPSTICITAATCSTSIIHGRGLRPSAIREWRRAFEGGPPREIAFCPASKNGSTSRCPSRSSASRRASSGNWGFSHRGRHRALRRAGSVPCGGS